MFCNLLFHSNLFVIRESQAKYDKLTMLTQRSIENLGLPPRGNSKHSLIFFLYSNGVASPTLGRKKSTGVH